jgi:uncharacterized membrane protein
VEYCSRTEGEEGRMREYVDVVECMLIIGIIVALVVIIFAPCVLQ